MGAQHESSGALRVLITEDSRTIRGFLVRQVRTMLPTAQIEECEHGAHAMECLRRSPADLVLTDLQMPHLGGEDFLLQGRASGLLGQSAVVVISSAITPGVRLALQAFDRIHFLRKPATGDEVCRAIRTLIGPVEVIPSR